MLLKSLFALIPALVVALAVTSAQSAPLPKHVPPPKPLAPLVLTSQGKGPQAGTSVNRRVVGSVTAKGVSNKVRHSVVVD